MGHEGEVGEDGSRPSQRPLSVPRDQAGAGKVQCKDGSRRRTLIKPSAVIINSDDDHGSYHLISAVLICQALG